MAETGGGGGARRFTRGQFFGAIAATALVVGGLVSGGFALAAPANTANTYYACAASNTLVLPLPITINTPPKCGKGQTVVSWNQSGQIGGTGLQGLPGAVGGTGSKGDAGAKGGTGLQGLPGAVGGTGPKGDPGTEGNGTSLRSDILLPDTGLNRAGAFPDCLTDNDTHTTSAAVAPFPLEAGLYLPILTGHVQTQAATQPLTVDSNFVDVPGAGSASVQVMIEQPGQASDFYSRSFGASGTVEDTFNPVLFVQGDVTITVTEKVNKCGIAGLTGAHVAFVKVGSYG